MEMVNIVGMTSAEIEAAMADFGEPRYRARQIYAGVYRRLWRGWEQFTDIGKPLREKLSSRFSIEYPNVSRIFVSRDGTRRYLFDAGDGLRMEAVFIPEENRDTLCISTQVGCAMAAFSAQRAGCPCGEICPPVKSSDRCCLLKQTAAYRRNA